MGVIIPEMPDARKQTQNPNVSEPHHRDRDNRDAPDQPTLRWLDQRSPDEQVDQPASIPVPGIATFMLSPLSKGPTILMTKPGSVPFLQTIR